MAEEPMVDKIVEYKAVPMHNVEDRTIEMRDGASITVRIYHPSQKKNLPIIVYYHGGGFVLRNLDTHDKACRRLAQYNEAIVVSVGYRLAPEFKFPIPVHDCYDATVWAAEHAKDLGANPDQLIVAGDSAGGNLATVVSTLARDLNGPKIVFQILIYPTTDARLCHKSIDTYGKNYLLTKELMHWFVDQYKSKEEDILNPLMSPFLQADLSNLPPAFIGTAEYDPLKDEGEAYAKRLQEAGNEVFFKEYKGVIHAFFNLGKITKQTFTMNEDIQQSLSAALAKQVVESK